MKSKTSTQLQLIRTIHPVGQGAFYTEHLFKRKECRACIVYDCGSTTPDNALQKEIESTFQAYKKIDVLFLSHLDLDHVNGINLLKDAYCIKQVVLPLMSQEARELVFVQGLASCPKDTSKKDINDFHDLVFRPGDFFGGIPVSFVRPADSSSNPGTPQEIGSLSGKAEIDSFQELTWCGWKYVPFNFEQKDRCRIFKERLAACPLLKGRPVAFDTSLFDDKETLKAVKCIYKSLPGGINGNSLMLYSGPLQEGCLLKVDVEGEGESEKPEKDHSGFCRAGCLYTGDMNLKAEGAIPYIRRLPEKDLDNLHLIQVPHHGSKHSYDKALLALNPNVQDYFLSYGTKNRYKHPHAEVRDSLKRAGKNLHAVSEQENTRYELQYSIVW